MKKLYQSSDWIQHSLRSAENKLRRRQSKRLAIRKRNQRLARTHRTFEHSYSSNVSFISKQKGLRIVVPSVFSIGSNTDEMLDFFDETNYYANKAKRIYLDMAGINQLNADAILYMLSVFDYWDKRLHFTNIGGNFPQDPICNRLLLESGFLNHVHSNVNKSPIDSKILAIRTGTEADGRVAEEVIQFARRWLGKPAVDNTRGVYGTLIECMVNTKHHAFPTRTKTWQWWLMAMFDEQKNKVAFSYLDNGLGIPHTVRKDLPEFVARKTGFLENDGALIHSALRGELRSRTREHWRGKGLPTILGYSNKKKIKDLIVVSNKGYVEASKSYSRELTKKFHGTLLSWNFV